MKVLPLRGFKSLRALNTFHVLLLGLKMLPAYALTPYEKFFEDFTEKSDKEKEDAIREAVVFVPLSQDEIESVLSFAADKNGIGYTAVNVKSLGPDEIHEIIVAVCMEIGRIKITLVTPGEKKK